jgi:hypothetical protein
MNFLVALEGMITAHHGAREATAIELGQHLGVSKATMLNSLAKL